jgi:hypothetical protein
MMRKGAGVCALDDTGCNHKPTNTRFILIPAQQRRALGLPLPNGDFHTTTSKSPSTEAPCVMNREAGRRAPVMGGTGVSEGEYVPDLCPWLIHALSSLQYHAALIVICLLFSADAGVPWCHGCSS